MIFVKHSLYRCFFIFQGISQDAQCIFEAFFLQVIRQLYTRTGCRCEGPPVIFHSGLPVFPSDREAPKSVLPGVLPVARQTSTPALLPKLSPLCNIVSVLLPYILSVIFHFASFLLPSTVRVRATPGCGWRLVL